LKLGDGNTIFKLVGPVLLKQEHAEAKMSVDSRVDFITKEMYVHTRLVNPFRFSLAIATGLKNKSKIFKVKSIKSVDK
jgi:hypothetical protein